MDRQILDDLADQSGAVDARAGGEQLYSRPLLSLVISAIHGGSLPARMWIPSDGFHAARPLKRMRPRTFAADSESVPLTAPAPIEFLGAESYLAGEDVPFWNSSLPFLFFKTESNCSLTVYTDDAADMSIGPVLTNYQDVLHQQAGLTTTGDVWPNGCLSSASECRRATDRREDRRRDLLRRGRDYLRHVRIVDFDNGWNRKQRDHCACVPDFADDARNAGDAHLGRRQRRRQA